jgi:hypothetical protein
VRVPIALAVLTLVLALPAAAGAGTIALSRTAAEEPLELLPDLDVVEPRLLTLGRYGREWRLGFASAVDNLGLGPLIVEGRRRPSERLMRTRQRVMLQGGGSRVYDDAGWFRYVYVETHSHWHYLPYTEYELRPFETAELAVRDRKMGFCLSDRHRSRKQALAPLARPTYLHFCGPGQPGLVAMSVGQSVGYSDQYSPLREGQYLALSGLPAGRYILVHRANPDYRVREIDYTNNAASLLVGLTWRAGTPKVNVLKTCPDDELCGVTATAAGMLARP